MLSHFRCVKLLINLVRFLRLFEVNDTFHLQTVRFYDADKGIYLLVPVIFYI